MQTKPSSNIAKQLIVYVILFSSLITLITTGIQLYAEYDRDISNIDTRFEEIKSIHLKNLASRVWVADRTEIENQLEGLKNLPFMQYLEVRDEKQVLAKTGVQKSEQTISKSYPINYLYQNKTHNIGTLIVKASLTSVYEHIYQQLWKILLSNTIKTFLVSGFILFLFHQLITRHLVNISKFTSKLTINDLTQPLKLDRQSNNKKADELDTLVESITNMQQNLQASISSLETANITIHESRERYKNLLETSNAIPWELDLSNWRFTYVGPQVVELLGYPQSDWYEEDFWVNNLHPVDKEHAIEYCTGQTKLKQDHEFEYRMVGASGREVWIRDSVTVISDETGPVKLRGFIFDITEHKKAKTEIERKQNQVKQHQKTLLYIAKNQHIKDNSTRSASMLTNETLCNSLHASSSAIWLYDGNYQTIHCIDCYDAENKLHTHNKTLKNINHSLGESSIISIDYKSNVGELLPEIHFFEDNPDKISIEAPIKRGDNIIGIIIVERDKKNKRNKTDKNEQDWNVEEQSFINSTADIVSFTLEFWKHTETSKQLEKYQKHLESLVEERTQQIHEQAIIIDQIHDAVISTDLNNIITSWNRGAEQLFGYQGDEVVGQSINQLFPAQARSLFDNLLINKLIEIDSIEIETTMRDKNDTDFYALLSLSILHDSENKPKGVVSYALDISDRKRAEESLLQHTGELSAVNKELEAFCYSVSHDLRTPLRSIAGFSSALRDEYLELFDDTGKNYLDRVENAAMHMSTLIDNLLNLSRVTRKELDYKNVNLNDLVHDIIIQNDFPVDIFYLENNLKARGDQALLNILLTNLISNSVKYSQFVEKPKIEIGKIEKNSKTTFYVRDNGAGFDEQYSKNLFLPFQRLHSESEFEGSGIGLATAQRIIDKHHGKIWAKSAPNEGATFFFTIGKYKMIDPPVET